MEYVGPGDQTGRPYIFPMNGLSKRHNFPGFNITISKFAVFR